MLATPLPMQVRPLIGRARDVDSVRALLLDERARLVTLVGPGGVGKTRLALAVADRLVDDFADGVRFVDLAPVRNPGLVVPTIAEVLGVRETPTLPPAEALVAALRDASLLLVLDNCEQVVGAAPRLAALLAECPGLFLLASSREPLGLSWEQLFQVEPLGLPTTGSARPEEVERAPAAALFVQHARAVRPGFSVSSGNAAAVAEICRRLDGLPLAIELAGARARVMSADAMLLQLQQRPLQLLSGGARDAPPRHRTLRDAIAWSYELLEPGQQAMFRRLAVCVGGCTLEAVEALAGDVGGSDALEALVDKHLVRPLDQDDGDVRVQLLETIREFGREQLEAAGELDDAHTRHATYLVELAERAAPALYGHEQQIWIQRLAREHDNIRAALDWCAAADDPQVLELGLRLGGALWLFWRVRGFVREGRARLARLLARDGEASVARARALYAAGYLAFAQGAADAARPLLERSLAMARETRDLWSQGYALQGLGHAELLSGNFAQANALYEERLAVAQSNADDYGVAQALNALGEVARCLDDPDRARPLYEQSLAVRRRLGDTRGVGMGLANVGHMALAAGDPARARDSFVEAFELARGLGNLYGAAVSLSGLAGLAVANGDRDRAARLLGAAEAALEAVGSSLEPPDRMAHERTSGELGPESDAARVEGRTLSVQELAELVHATPARTERAESPAGHMALLSPREWEVAALIARGQTSQDIAEALVITKRTADTHAAHIRDKLGLRSRAEIAAWVTSVTKP
jgi:non-specific serine/threonine protein kinase